MVQAPYTGDRVPCDQEPLTSNAHPAPHPRAAPHVILDSPPSRSRRDRACQRASARHTQARTGPRQIRPRQSHRFHRSPTARRCRSRAELRSRRRLSCSVIGGAPSLYYLPRPGFWSGTNSAASVSRTVMLTAYSPLYKVVRLKHAATLSLHTETELVILWVVTGWSDMRH